MNGRAEVDDQIIAYIEASSSAEKTRLERERQAERKRIEAEGAATRERLEREAERFEHEAQRRKLDATAATKLARRTRIAAAIALVLGIGAAAGAVVGFKGQEEAIREAARAEKNSSQAQAAEASAIEARNQALRNQSLSLSFLSKQTAETGDTEVAILLGLEALPTNTNTPDRPLQFEAEAALYGAILRHRQIMVFRHDAGLTDAEFNPDGTRIVTASFDKTARIWNVADGTQLALLRGHEGPVDKAMFSPEGGRVITAARNGTARVWNVATGEQTPKSAWRCPSGCIQS